MNVRPIKKGRPSGNDRPSYLTVELGPEACWVGGRGFRAQKTLFSTAHTSPNRSD